MDATVILCDNQICMKIIENHVFHYKKNHIEIRYLYIHDIMQKGAINLQYVSTNEQVTNVLTKHMSCVKFEHFQDKIGVIYKDFHRKGE